MYFKKIRPSTTCLYSAAPMLLRSLSAVSQSLASKPRLAAVPFEEQPLADFLFAILFCRGAVSVMWNEAGGIRSESMPFQSCQAGYSVIALFNMGDGVPRSRSFDVAV